MRTEAPNLYPINSAGFAARHSAGYGLKANAPPLGEAEVFAACRALYDAAAEDFILPPFLGDLESLSTISSRNYVVQTEANRIRFCVEFDPTFTETGQFPLARIPLLFSGGVRQKTGQAERRLQDDELYSLISAFLLGVKTPMILERNIAFPYSRILLQLSSTAFLECGELLDQGADLMADMICRRVSISLYDKSRDFFQTSREGLGVWISRVGQELFGAPKPSSETLWPTAGQKAEVEEGAA